MKTNLAVLYRIYNADDELLYVGATTNPAQRVQSHDEMQSWWSEAVTIKMEHYRSQEELGAAEIAAIRAEGPRYNLSYAQPPVWSRKSRRPRGEGSIFQRSLDGKWVGRVELEPINGRRRKRAVLAASRSEVEEKLAAIKAELKSSPDL